MVQGRLNEGKHVQKAYDTVVGRTVDKDVVYGVGEGNWRLRCRRELSLIIVGSVEYHSLVEYYY